MSYQDRALWLALTMLGTWAFVAPETTAWLVRELSTR